MNVAEVETIIKSGDAIEANRMLRKYMFGMSQKDKRGYYMNHTGHTFKIERLKCNYTVNPMGVETTMPLLSWVMHSKQRKQGQTAYRILVATSLGKLNEEQADLWDSGLVASDQSANIEYKGSSLSSRLRCYWMVCVKGKDSDSCVWSEPAFFEMGLLNESDWKAKWIAASSCGTDIKKATPAPLFRKPFLLEKEISKARVYVCGLGYYELYINGNKIGDEVLAPPFTTYNKTVMYNIFDVTGELIKGKNAIGMILGNGWYNSFESDSWEFQQSSWRHHPKLIVQLEITFKDGDLLTIISDTSWKTADSPIIFNGLRNGEYYDSRLETLDWSAPVFDDDAWTKSLIVSSPGGVLKSAQLPPMRVMKTMKPVSIREVKPDVWVYDLGQCIAGWAQISISGTAGTEIVLKYAEKLNDDGTIDQANIDWLVNSGEFQTDKYILKGQGIEVWEPRFTYHGFQYIQITGFNGVLTIENLCGRLVHTDLEVAGEFECSNELINKIQTCARWSTLDNYHGIPTDCPHREKNGWTGDASLSSEQVLINFDPVTAYTKWMYDFKDAQRFSGQVPGIVPTGGWGFNWGNGPAFDSAMFLIPWNTYVYTGNISILNDMYANMRQYVNYLETMSIDYLVDFGLGDWCPPRGENDSYTCLPVITNTAYFYVETKIVAKIATLLGKVEDERKYTVLAESIRNEFRRNFFDEQTYVVKGNSQSSISCALYQGLINDDEKSSVLNKLVEQVELMDRHIDCGIFGTQYIVHALTELGRADLVYDIATQTTFPSWGYWITLGANTLWEKWNGDASRCHHMFSDISAWFYKGLAGINPDPEEPGFKHIIIKPNVVKDLKWVKAWHQSVYGMITCNWKYQDEYFDIEIVIPAGCTATVHLPTSTPDYIFEGKLSIYDCQCADIKIDSIMEEKNKVIINIESGEYHFSTKFKLMSENNILGN